MSAVCWTARVSGGGVLARRETRCWVTTGFFFESNMMKLRVKAEITFLSKDAGGRKSMPDKEYVPHLMIQDPTVKLQPPEPPNFSKDEYFVARMVRFPRDGELNEKYLYELEFFSAPQSDYSVLKPNVTFVVREGSRTVGFGKILERFAS